MIARMRGSVTLYVHCVPFNAYIQYLRYQNTTPQIECVTSNTPFRDGVRVSYFSYYVVQSSNTIFCLLSSSCTIVVAQLIIPSLLQTTSVSDSPPASPLKPVFCDVLKMFLFDNRLCVEDRLLTMPFVSFNVYCL
jgi:hypothetical protein